MKCFYHSSDLDGHCSGAIVKHKYPDCEMIGINYGEEFPWETIQFSESVFMVDFSLQPFSEMQRLNSRCRLTWIDHHKTAIEEELKSSQVIEGIREEGKAGCELAWEFLFPDEEMPVAVRLLGRYDVWDHSNKYVLPFQYGMRQAVTKPDAWGNVWGKLLSDDHGMFDDIYHTGLVIHEYQAQQNEKYAKSAAFETTLDGLNLIAVNAMLTNSKIFDSVYDPVRHDAMCCFGWRKGRWTVSLYSANPDQVDVSRIAKTRGGGGHPGAAGFQCDELPFALR